MIKSTNLRGHGTTFLSFFWLFFQSFVFPGSSLIIFVCGKDE